MLNTISEFFRHPLVVFIKWLGRFASIALLPPEPGRIVPIWFNPVRCWKHIRTPNTWVLGLIQNLSLENRHCITPCLKISC